MKSLIVGAAVPAITAGAVGAGQTQGTCTTVDYGWIGENKIQCEKQFGDLQGEITHYRSCDWHRKFASKKGQNRKSKGGSL